VHLSSNLQNPKNREGQRWKVGKGYHSTRKYSGTQQSVRLSSSELPLPPLQKPRPLQYVEPIPPPPVPGPAHAYVRPVEGVGGPSSVAIRDGRFVL